MHYRCNNALRRSALRNGVVAKHLTHSCGKILRPAGALRHPVASLIDPENSFIFNQSIEWYASNNNNICLKVTRYDRLEIRSKIQINDDRYDRLMQATFDLQLSRDLIAISKFIVYFFLIHCVQHTRARAKLIQFRCVNITLRAVA